MVITPATNFLLYITDIAHLRGVYGTELREEIDWQEGVDGDSSDDDVMQQ